MLAQPDNNEPDAKTPRGNMGALERIFKAPRRVRFLESDIFVLGVKKFRKVVLLQHKTFV